MSLSWLFLSFLGTQWALWICKKRFFLLLKSFLWLYFYISVIARFVFLLQRLQLYVFWIFFSCRQFQPFSLWPFYLLLYLILSFYPAFLQSSLVNFTRIYYTLGTSQFILYFWDGLVFFYSFFAEINQLLLHHSPFFFPLWP